VTKALLERALAEEMTGHLGYDKHDPARRGSGNGRNGTNPQDGPDRCEHGGPGHAALYARGMTTRDIRRTCGKMYDIDVSPDLISRVTDGSWRNSPKGSPGRWTAFPVVFIDALMVKIRD
jgi:putative transposase